MSEPEYHLSLDQIADSLAIASRFGFNKDHFKKQINHIVATEVKACLERLKEQAFKEWITASDGDKYYLPVISVSAIEAEEGKL